MNLKTILITTFWKQNSWHQYGVLRHTLMVTWACIRRGHFRMITAGLLHDIGKPFSATQKPEDIINKEYSFTDHEELSYQIIKNWPLISDYSKNLVRHHYLIRRKGKAKSKGLAEYDSLQKTWESLSPEFQSELAIFMRCDDEGKGKPKPLKSKESQ